MYFLFQIPINSALIAAILTIIGYSINDTVVIFDRIRENLVQKGSKRLEEVTDASISQTMVRTINTSLTVVIILVLVYFFVPQIRDFTFPLLLGSISGVYSSIFIASPIFVMLEKRLGRDKSSSKALLVKPAPVKGTVTKGAELAQAETQEETETTKKSVELPKKQAKYSNLYTKKTGSANQSSTQSTGSNHDVQDGTEETVIKEIPLADDFKFSKSTHESLKKIKFDEDEY